MIAAVEIVSTAAIMLFTLIVVFLSLSAVFLSLLWHFIKWAIGFPIKVKVTRGKEEYFIYYRWFTRIK
jgi:hypothetical protein